MERNNATEHAISGRDDQAANERHDEHNVVNIAGSNYGHINVSRPPGNEPVETDEKWTFDTVKGILQKAQEQQKRHKRVKGINVSTKDVPVVHPGIIQVSFYESDISPEQEKYDPSYKNIKDLKQGNEIQFSDLSDVSTQESRFVGLVGFPGTGKTTCCERLGNVDSFITLRLRFAEINHTDPLTLQELLIDNAYPDLEKKERDKLFQWVKKNQKKVLIIMDGLDQAGWSFGKDFPKVVYEKSQPVSNLVASLFNKHFLPGARLIVASRPHTMLKLPEDLHPDVTYLLCDLSLEDTKTLFDFFTGERASELWSQLETSAPQLVSLCQCPLLLILYVQAALHPSDEIGEISTMTRIFATVLENLLVSGHARQCDINKIKTQISELAFNATDQGTVVITMEQIMAVSLNAETIQDLIIPLYGHSFPGASNLFEGHSKFYFWHQSLQEYFAALHICKKMTVDRLKDFLDKLYTSEWMMVRRFVCGVLFNIQAKDDEFSAPHQIPTSSKYAKDEEKVGNKLENSRSHVDSVPSRERVVEREDSNVPNTSTKETVASAVSQREEMNIRKPFKKYRSFLKKIGPRKRHSKKTTAMLKQGAERADITKKSPAMPGTSAESIEKQSPEEELEQKRHLLLTRMKEEMEKIGEMMQKGRQRVRKAQQPLIDLCTEVRECNSSDVTKHVASCFPRKVMMRAYNFTASSAHALSHVMRNATKKVEELHLGLCGMDHRIFSYICDAIKARKTSIEELVIHGNKLTDVEQICEIFPKIEAEVVMRDCFAGDEGRSRIANAEEIAKVKEALIIQNTILQIELDPNNHISSSLQG